MSKHNKNLKSNHKTHLLEHMKLYEEVRQQEKDRQEVIDVFKEYDLRALNSSDHKSEEGSDAISKGDGCE